MKLLWGQLQTEIKGKMIPVELSELENDKLLPPLYKVEIVNQERHQDQPHSSTLHKLPAPNGSLNKEVILAKVIQNKRITAVDHF
jgi:hypothetical protein